jgi:hypothetical protein
MAPRRSSNTPSTDEAVKDEHVPASANDTIPHTDGGVTTRSDATDLGVVAEPAKDPSAERVGPEDALDPNSRGDYSDRLITGPSVRMEPVPGAKAGESNVKAVEVVPGIKAPEVPEAEAGPDAPDA